LFFKIIRLVLFLVVALPVSGASENEPFSVLAANLNAWNYNTNRISSQIWELGADVIVFIEWNGIGIDREGFRRYYDFVVDSPSSKRSAPHLKFHPIQHQSPNGVKSLHASLISSTSPHHNIWTHLYRRRDRLNWQDCNILQWT
jgi:hypothetical protein